MDVGRNSVYLHDLSDPLHALDSVGVGVPVPDGSNVSLVELGKRLLSACQEGEDDEVRELMSRGAPFTTDWLGTSPLHLSALHGHLGTVKILLRAGISRDARTKVDKTPLHFAAQDGHTEIVEALLKNGADVDALDMLHMTPLHWAVERGNVSTVEMILRYGGSTNIESKFDKTPLEIASDNGRPDIFEMLQNAEQFRHMAESDAATMAATRSIMLDEPQEEEHPVPSPAREAVPTASQQEVVSTGRNETENEALKLLEAQGITLLPEDPGGLTLNDGQSIELTEAGKLAFGIQSSVMTPVTSAPKLVTTSTTKPSTITVSNVVKRKIAVTPVASNRPTTITKVVSLKSAPLGVSKTISSTNLSGIGSNNQASKPTKTRVITLTPQQFAAIKSNNVSQISNIIAGDKRKLPSVTTTSISPSGIGGSSSLNSDTRKIRIVPIKLNSSASNSTSSSGLKPQVVSAIPKTLTTTTTRVLTESESLKRQLEEARKAAESYKEELRKKEEEANRLKEQLQSLYGNTQQQHC